MNKNDVVNIYADPGTQHEIEGQAKLVNLLWTDTQGNRERWSVRFLDDGFVTDRWVLLR